MYEVPSEDAFAVARRLLTEMLSLKRDGNIWTVIRFLTMALTDKHWEPRFVLVLSWRLYLDRRTGERSRTARDHVQIALKLYTAGSSPA